MKTINIFFLILLTQAVFFAVSCQEDNAPPETPEKEKPELSDTLGMVQTIPAIEGAIQTRLAAGTNGVFHLVYLVPSKTEDNQPVEGEMFLSRFRNEKWDTPLKIADLALNQVPIHFADLAADGKGNTYVVWVNKSRNLFYSVKIDKNNKIQLETRPTRAALRADVTVDNQDVAFALYRDKSPEENHFLKRTAESNAWTSIGKTPDNDTKAGQRQPSIVAGRENILYYGYRWMDGGAGDRRVAFRTYDTENGNWGPVLKPTSPEKPWGPQLAVDGQNELHMAWGAGYEPDIKMYYRAPDGKITNLEKGLGEKSWPPAMAAADSGKVVMVISTGEDYHSVAPSGKVFVYNISENGISDALPIDDTNDNQGWGHLAFCSSTGRLMAVWVADGKVKYRFNDKN